MPWSDMSKQNLRLEFVTLAASGGIGFRALCRRFGISAKTGCKWRTRFASEGEAGFPDRSRRPRGAPSRTPGAVEKAVLAVRAEHPAWGGRKIAAVVTREGGTAPAPSTVTAILRRNGVELGAFGGGAPPFKRFEHAAPNDLWQMDFKGHVAMRQGRLHPLDAIDDHSRFLVLLAACDNERTETARDCLVKAFRLYGLPLCMMMDNGPPWGGPAACFNPPTVFLIEQGIRVGHSRPCHPQTNGKIERQHRAQKAEVLSGPPFDNLEHAQRKLSEWRDIYNTRRPHEAIGMAVPLDRHAPSPRPYKDVVEPFEYGPDDIVRRVQTGGDFTCQGRDLRVPKAFHGKQIALRPDGPDGCFKIFFRHQFVAGLDMRSEIGNPQPVTHVPEQA